MGKHTPGPWTVKINPDGDWASQWPNIIGADGYIVVGTEGIYGEYETDIVNAKLIAAAPDLLEALQGVQIMANCGQFDEFIGEPWLKAVSAAIKKATE